MLEKLGYQYQNQNNSFYNSFRNNSRVWNADQHPVLAGAYAIVSFFYITWLHIGFKAIYIINVHLIIPNARLLKVAHH